ncbi:MAG: hypothetical protein ABIH26_09185 [Candidatus Eisenbacteria bacterium]
MGFPLSSRPYVSIVRYWERQGIKQVPKTAGSSTTVSWQVRTGIDRTHSEEFTETWGGEAGLGIKGFEAKVKNEFSSTVSDIETWSYEEIRDTMETKELPAIDYADRIWVSWIPVEEYRFTDASGRYFTDKNWKFIQESLGVKNYRITYEDVFFYK